MARKFTTALLDHAQGLIDQGMTLKDVGERVGVNADNLSKHLRARGVQTDRRCGRPAHNRITDFDEDGIESSYRMGCSVLEIAKSLNTSRNVIDRILKARSVGLRTQTEANFVRLQKLSDDERRALTAPARAGLTCSPMPKAHLARAMGAENGTCQINRGPGEAELIAALERAGHEPRPQVRCELYNIDIALGPLAVEVKSSGGRQAHGKERAKVEALFKAGWGVVYVHFSDATGIARGLDNVVALLEVAKRNPPPKGQYWVIRCGLQQSPIGRTGKRKLPGVFVPPELVTSVRHCEFC